VAVQGNALIDFTRCVGPDDAPRKFSQKVLACRLGEYYAEPRLVRHPPQS
jgi:hypothetical protein